MFIFLTSCWRMRSSLKKNWDVPTMGVVDEYALCVQPLASESKKLTCQNLPQKRGFNLCGLTVWGVSYGSDGRLFANEQGRGEQSLGEGGGAGQACERRTGQGDYLV